MGSQGGVIMETIVWGMDSRVVSLLKKARVDVVFYVDEPKPEATKGKLFYLTSDSVPNKSLFDLKQRHEDCSIIFHQVSSSLRGHLSVAVLCAELGIKYLGPNSTTQDIIDLVKSSQGEVQEREGKVLSFFGSKMGVGCTSVAKYFSKALSAMGADVIMLGLDLYDPGNISLSFTGLTEWKVKLTTQSLSDKDFENMPKVDGYRYLSGNSDILSVSEYTEVEIEYLLQEAAYHCDVLVCDFGALPDTAAWYKGLQQPGMYFYVSMLDDFNRFVGHKEIFDGLSLSIADFNLIVNHSNIYNSLGLTSFQKETGMPLYAEIGHYNDSFGKGVIELNKKEASAVETKLAILAQALGLKKAEVKRKGLF